MLPIRLLISVRKTSLHMNMVFKSETWRYVLSGGGMHIMRGGGMHIGEGMHIVRRYAHRNLLTGKRVNTLL